jgi:riboflavin kinase/FMN adenylyltransferase
MIVIRGSSPSKKLLNIIKTKTNNKQMAVTIGSFDGLHIGHRFIFNKLFEVATQQNLSKVLVTFEPRPVDYFTKVCNRQPANNFGRLTLLSDKLFLLKKLGFDIVWVINFNKDVAKLSAQEFLYKLHSVLDIQYLVVGLDFRFGKKRSGDIELLNEFALKNNFILESVNDYNVDGQRVSSSFIRDLLTSVQDNTKFLEIAAKYLARYYGFSGYVVSGQREGRKLGYPTVNLNVKPRQLLLPQGVYAVNIFINDKKYHAMANWGVRPTIAKILGLVLEAHVFDFDADIYGQKVYIEFLIKIRAEQRFNSRVELQAQLARDYEAVTHFFNNQGMVI